MEEGKTKKERYSKLPSFGHTCRCAVWWVMDPDEGGRPSNALACLGFCKVSNGDRSRLAKASVMKQLAEPKSTTADILNLLSTYTMANDCDTELSYWATFGCDKHSWKPIVAFPAGMSYSQAVHLT